MTKLTMLWLALFSAQVLAGASGLNEPPKPGAAIVLR